VDSKTLSVLEQIGNPADIDRELQIFRREARALAHRQRELKDRYRDQWIAVFDGEVRAAGRTFESVLKQVDREGLPKERTLVRYIDEDDRAMIL
jgi:hypothetical protein